MIAKLKIGVAGLGRAFSLMLPAFTLDPRVELVAGADPRAEARARFEGGCHQLERPSQAGDPYPQLAHAR